jgi:hypothetical protein
LYIPFRIPGFKITRGELHANSDDNETTESGKKPIFPHQSDIPNTGRIKVLELSFAFVRAIFRVHSHFDPMVMVTKHDRNGELEGKVIRDAIIHVQLELLIDRFKLLVFVKNLFFVLEVDGSHPIIRAGLWYVTIGEIGTEGAFGLDTWLVADVQKTGGGSTTGLSRLRGGY